jgi:hypothetical protein
MVRNSMVKNNIAYKVGNCTVKPRTGWGIGVAF